jgi:hypothetical protein
MRVIRASEIGAYLYCHRAWWYQIRGFPSQNRTELAAGTRHHLRNSRRAFQAAVLRLLAWILLLAALALLAAWAVRELL